MIIEAAEEDSKTAMHAAADEVARRSEDEISHVEGPPPYTYGQSSHLAMPPLQPHTLPSSLPSNDMPTSNLSSPLSSSSSHSHFPVQHQALFPPPVLRVTTIPHDFQSSQSHEQSSLLSPSQPARSTPRAIARFFTSFFVALGIIFLWLLFVQGIRIAIFGHGGFPWGPPPPSHGRHGRPSRGGPGHWNRAPPTVVKPSFGTSKPYTAYSTRYPSSSNAPSTTSLVLPTPTEAVSTGARRVVITADR